ncbi:hypothetical protein D3C77_365800 [compost metagenome]
MGQVVERLQWIMVCLDDQHRILNGAIAYKIGIQCHDIAVWHGECTQLRKYELFFSRRKGHALAGIAANHRFEISCCGQPSRHFRIIARAGKA